MSNPFKCEDVCTGPGNVDKTSASFFIVHVWYTRIELSETSRLLQTQAWLPEEDFKCIHAKLCAQLIFIYSCICTIDLSKRLSKWTMQDQVQEELKTQVCLLTCSTPLKHVWRSRGMSNSDSIDCVAQCFSIHQKRLQLLLRKDRDKLSSRTFLFRQFLSLDPEFDNTATLQTAPQTFSHDVKQHLKEGFMMHLTHDPYQGRKIHFTPPDRPIIHRCRVKQVMSWITIKKSASNQVSANLYLSALAANLIKLSQGPLWSPFGWW